MTERNIKARLREVRGFAFDVDGVCTNSQVILAESGELLRNANTRDGLAVNLAVQAGYPVAIITGGRSESVRGRFHQLGVTDIYLGTLDKLRALEEFCALHALEPANVLYMGDDLPDLPPLQRAGVAACPLDAVYEIKQASDYISPFPGGGGCVRDVIEQVLRLRGDWRFRPDLKQ